jgi:hypothetical protein
VHRRPALGWIGCGLDRFGLIALEAPKKRHRAIRHPGEPARPHEPEPVQVTTDPTESRTAVHVWAAFGLSALLFSVAGRIDQAPFYFGAQAAMMIGLKVWFTWHRRNPPIPNAGSTKRGVLSALAHAAGAFGVGLFFLYVLRRSFPDMMVGADWLHTLEILIFPPGLAVMTYQRRTAWHHDDPERMVIIGAVTAVFVAALFVLRLVR